MGNISVSQVTDGPIAHATDINNPINTIVSEFNGNIDNTNIKAGAAIDVSKLAQNNGQLAIKPVIAYKFDVYRGANVAVGTAFQKVSFDTKNFDTGSNVDIVTNVGRFTAPVAGFYQFDATVTIASSATSIYIVTLYKNSSEVARGTQSVSGSAAGTTAGTVSRCLQLAANDIIEVYVYNGAGGAANVSGGSQLTFFSGYLVSV